VPDLFYCLAKSYGKKISGYAAIRVSCRFTGGGLIIRGKNF